MRDLPGKLGTCIGHEGCMLCDGPVSYYIPEILAQSIFVGEIGRSRIL